MPSSTKTTYLPRIENTRTVFSQPQGRVPVEFGIQSVLAQSIQDFPIKLPKPTASNDILYTALSVLLL